MRGNKEAYAVILMALPVLCSVMERSPEVEPVRADSIESLLLQHDQDPYGYIGQAITMLGRDQAWHGHPAYVVPIAKFAAETHDTALMQSCMAELGDGEQWRLLAYETREGHATIDVNTVRKMGERLAVLEAEPEQQLNYGLLADIYASQLDIVLHTGGGNLEDQLRKLTAAIRGGNAIYLDPSRRAAESLLDAGLDDAAQPFIELLLPDDDELLRERRTLAEMQRLRKRGKPIPHMRDYWDSGYEVLRLLDPQEYIAQRDRSGDLRAGINATGPKDVLTLLQAGQTARAQDLYSGLLEHGPCRPPDRLQISLWLTQYTGEGKNEAVDDAVTATEGCKKLAQLMGTNAVPDVAAASTARLSLESQMQSACDRVGRLPLSSERIALAVQLAEIQRSSLPRSSVINNACAKLVTDAWDTIRRTMMNPHQDTPEDYPAAVLRLWHVLKNHGFDFYLRGTPEAQAIDSARDRANAWMGLNLAEATVGDESEQRQ
jgi:hypothetical protein